MEDKEWLYQTRYWWADTPEMVNTEYYGTELEANIARDQIVRLQTRFSNLRPKLHIEVRRFEFAELISVQTI